MLSSIRIAICDFSSASISCPTLERAKRFEIRRTSDIGTTSCVAQYVANTLHQVFEVFFCFLQLLPARAGQLVILCLAVGLRQRPLRTYPSALFHAVQSRVERTFLYAQRLSPQNGQSLDLLSPPDSSELAMQMFFGTVWLSLIVVIRFVVELFRKHIFDPWFSDRL
jgi:hypothetical protein